MRIKWAQRYYSFDGLVVAFAALAVALRLFFWFYTHRVWEDSLIALASVRNMYDGLGLTQHVGEPRIYSFSSPLDVIVFAAGAWANQGITAVRIASLLSSVIAIVLAGRIFDRCNLNTVGRVACLSYLACDHLQIFFGMSGMETQMATAIAIALVYFSISGRPVSFGLAAGIAFLARPELMLVAVVCFLPFIAGIWKQSQSREAIGHAIKITSTAAVIIVPWIIFTALYYGSPIPHTVEVKNYTNGAPTLDAALSYLHHVWRQIAPFHEFWFVTQSPVPDSVLKAIAALMAALSFIGLAITLFERSPLWIACVSAAGFWVYLIVFHVNSYFMWYTPPFVALSFFAIAYAISAISRIAAPVATTLSAIAVISYAMHLPFTLPLDREHQTKVEDAVRRTTGIALSTMMRPGDTVFLEPLGYVGGEVRTRLVYDNPGLASDIAFGAYKKYGNKMVEGLNPDFLVLRRKDIETLSAEMPAFFGQYRERFHVESEDGPVLEYHGLQYLIGGDREFFIYQRPPTGVGATTPAS